MFSVEVVRYDEKSAYRSAEQPVYTANTDN